MKYYQQKIYSDINGVEQIIATFWTDSNGKVDMDNLPIKREIEALLSSLMISDVHVTFTGNSVDDD